VELRSGLHYYCSFGFLAGSMSRKILTVNKDIRQMIKTVEAQGWTVVKTRGDHLKWISPDNGFVISASTPSDLRRFFLNLKKELMKKGFIDVEKKGQGRR
jgi:predicted RNA binding protein YcfA (HicA-like mRNA interferase family)